MGKLIIILLLLSSNLYSQNAIIIGDSQTEDIAYFSKNVYMIPSLHKVGWWVINLNKSLKLYKTDTTITHVFICIGTNGVFSKYDKVEDLCDLIKIKFPNAIPYVIKGSYGWEKDNTNIPNINDKINIYYDRFYKKGITPIKYEIGYSKRHPSIKTNSIITISKYIDSITIKK